MSTFTHRFYSKPMLLLLSVILVLITVVSCAKKISFNTSSVVPAARGKVAIKKDDNKNYQIHLKISYLAEPDRLDPPKKTYVVWMVSNDSNTPINLGQIIGTSRLNIDFETVSAAKPSRIFITAENDPSIQYPGNVVVLETSNF